MQAGAQRMPDLRPRVSGVAIAPQAAQQPSARRLRHGRRLQKVKEIARAASQKRDRGLRRKHSMKKRG